MGSPLKRLDVVRRSDAREADGGTHLRDRLERGSGKQTRRTSACIMACACCLISCARHVTEQQRRAERREKRGRQGSSSGFNGSRRSRAPLAVELVCAVERRSHSEFDEISFRASALEPLLVFYAERAVLMLADRTAVQSNGMERRREWKGEGESTRESQWKADAGNAGSRPGSHREIRHFLPPPLSSFLALIIPDCYWARELHQQLHYLFFYVTKKRENEEKEVQQQA